MPLRPRRDDVRDGEGHPAPSPGSCSSWSCCRCRLRRRQVLHSGCWGLWRPPGRAERGCRVDETQRQAATATLATAVVSGGPWEAAATWAGLQTSRSTAYRLRQALCVGGEEALRD